MDKQKATVAMSGVRTAGRDKGDKYFKEQRRQSEGKDLEAIARAEF